MQITTEKFGEIEFEESAVISFTEGILGFPSSKRYILLNADKDSPFKWLQSVDDGSLAFLLIDPTVFKSDYKVKLDANTKDELSIGSREDYVIFVIVVVNADPTESTANLIGPIVLNIKNQRASQIVINNPGYSTRHRLIGE